MIQKQAVRKRPVDVEAWQLSVDDEPNATAHAIAEWCGGTVIPSSERSDATFSIAIFTLEGTMVADPGDWVIRGVKGEFYPIEDSIFRETYDIVDLEAESLARYQDALARGLGDHAAREEGWPSA